MKRQIIKIDQELCNGCGLCVNACHEGAIALVDGKAALLRDDYCDGLGNCLPVCPTGAITFEEREALAFNEEAVKKAGSISEDLPCGCPGTHARSIHHAPASHGEAASRRELRGDARPAAGQRAVPAADTADISSQLRQWPVQIKLVPPSAPYFKNANLLVAADCAAYAYGNFHNRFIKNHITLIGCPKLDDVDYSEKLTAILSMNDIRSVTVVRMSVPCCGGIEHAVKTALRASGKMIPWQVVVLSPDGDIQED
jgi:NAD-dependent dihydropyrimidine dehydrogenase PreA subunit